MLHMRNKLIIKNAMTLLQENIIVERKAENLQSDHSVMRKVFNLLMTHFILKLLITPKKQDKGAGGEDVAVGGLRARVFLTC